MKYLEIVESPQLIEPEDWNLGNKSSNIMLANRFLASDPILIKQYPIAKLMYREGNVGGEVALIERDGKLSYYVQYEIHSLNHLGRCATQVKLWRSMDASVKFLARTVFDEFLLTRFDTIVSDSHQTDRGREFWRTQIAGNSQTKTVGLIFKNEISVYDKNESIGDWVASQKAWGKDRKYRHMRFFISNLEII